MGARLIATRPPDGGTAAPGAAVVASLGLGTDWSPEEVRVWLDDADVTERCAIRTDRAWPPRRADVVLPDIDEGEHVARISWSGGGEATWRFSVRLGELPEHPGQHPHRPYTPLRGQAP